jgi:hypothetical protein
MAEATIVYEKEEHGIEKYHGPSGLGGVDPFNDVFSKPGWTLFDFALHERSRYGQGTSMTYTKTDASFTISGELHYGIGLGGSGATWKGSVRLLWAKAYPFSGSVDIPQLAHRFEKASFMAGDDTATHNQVSAVTNAIINNALSQGQAVKGIYEGHRIFANLKNAWYEAYETGNPVVEYTLHMNWVIVDAPSKQFYKDEMEKFRSQIDTKKDNLPKARLKKVFGWLKNAGLLSQLKSEENRQWHENWCEEQTETTIRNAMTQEFLVPLQSWIGSI